MGAAGLRENRGGGNAEGGGGNAEAADEAELIHRPPAGEREGITPRVHIPGYAPGCWGYAPGWVKPGCWG